MGSSGSIGGRYRVVGRLGEGGQAVVSRVVDERDGTERALKRLLPAFADKKKLRARFEAEARTLAGLSHPNLVAVTAVGEDGGLPWFVMELVSGGSLADRVDRHGPLPPRLAVEVLLQVCAGLSAAHAAGVIHRDVKPHNVLLALDGTCKVTDFGIARHGDAGLRTRAGAALGTEGFMAPEQAADAASVDARADVYGVGMTGYVLFTARDPFDFVKGRMAGVPPAVLPILLRCTEDAPADRFASIEELAAALRAALVTLPEDPAGTPPLTEARAAAPPAPRATAPIPPAPPAAAPPAPVPPAAAAPPAPVPPAAAAPPASPPAVLSPTVTPPGAERPLTTLSIGGRPGEVDAHLLPQTSRRWLAAAAIALVIGVAVAAAIALRPG